MGLGAFGVLLQQAGIGGSLPGLFYLINWALMPVSMYFDRDWLRANTHWNPHLFVWAGTALVPVLNIVVGAVYLFRRADVTGDRDASDGSSETDDSLDELRERYSKGEITDEEFEVQVERLLETEDRETAQQLLKSNRSESDAKSSAELPEK
jgi:uncharacterized membrane protein